MLLQKRETRTVLGSRSIPIGNAYMELRWKRFWSSFEMNKKQKLETKNFICLFQVWCLVVEGVLVVPLRCSGCPAGWESGPDRWDFLSPPSFPARWGGRAPSAPDSASRPADPPSWDGCRPAGWGVRGTGAPLWLWDRCCCYTDRQKRQESSCLANIKDTQRFSNPKTGNESSTED